jgi:hypothetical protein
MDQDLSGVNIWVREKIVWGYEVFYKADEEDEGREKSMGCVRKMGIIGI